jgi:hypothetical protein
MMGVEDERALWMTSEEMSATAKKMTRLIIRTALMEEGVTASEAEREVGYKEISLSRDWTDTYAYMIGALAALGLLKYDVREKRCCH